jgi:prolyl 4-hydroxylase
MKIQILNEDPKIVLNRNFLNEEEVNFLLSKNNFERSTVIGEYKDSLTANARTSQTYQDNKDEFREIRKKVYSFLNSIGFNYAFENYEGMQLIRYEKGQEFINHYDFLNFDPNNKKYDNERVGTVIIYLREPIEGGRTIFNKLDVSVTGHPGDLLFFRYDSNLRNDTLHTGEKVLEGVKIIATMFIREKRW